MKSIILILLSGMAISSAYSQVGVGTNAPAASAILELKSTTKGFLPPRLTTQQIKGISNPEAGLMVYNLNVNKPCYFNSTTWVYFDTSHLFPELGVYNIEAGGVVIYVDGTGVHGLAAATVDQGNGFDAASPFIHIGGDVLTCVDQMRCNVCFM